MSVYILNQNYSEYLENCQERFESKLQKFKLLIIDDIQLIN